MEVSQAIEARRAYRALEPAEISDETVAALANAASLAPSCFNNQPWRFAFVRSPEKLMQLRECYSKGNEWAHNASVVIAVHAAKEDDCVIREREYYLFDTGLACGQLILMATQLGLVAHPIAGFSPKKTRAVLDIAQESMLITLIIVGKRTTSPPEGFDPETLERDAQRPPRKEQTEFSVVV